MTRGDSSLHEKTLSRRYFPRAELTREKPDADNPPSPVCRCHERLHAGGGVVLDTFPARAHDHGGRAGRSALALEIEPRSGSVIEAVGRDSAPKHANELLSAMQVQRRFTAEVPANFRTLLWLIAIARFSLQTGELSLLFALAWISTEGNPTNGGR
jgi:hypothetical protein